ncbi:MAG: hypothetical protein L0099_04555 [Acidobacteria bacterium]|nr:hypothetical protein [Acidobacteriota bacterium]
MHTDILIPIPKGWVRHETGSEITIEGSLPDKDKKRNVSVRITFTVLGGTIQHLGKLRVWCEIYRGIGWDFTKQEYERCEWRSGGYGGVRLSTSLLWHLAHQGRHL